MRSLDIPHLVHFLVRMRKLTGPLQDIAILSPDAIESESMDVAYGIETKLFSPKITDWDVRNPAPRQYDLVLASNTFMAVAEPKVAIDNVFAACKYFVMLDHCRAFRGGGGFELDQHPVEANPDCMRYTMEPEMRALLPQAFDLNIYRDRLLLIHPYVTTPNGISFLAGWKGDLFRERSLS